jgi:CubicO group peptidase (beta-lactamase class C family)
VRPAGAEDKLAQLDRRARNRTTVDLGIPASPTPPPRTRPPATPPTNPGPSDDVEGAPMNANGKGRDEDTGKAGQVAGDVRLAWTVPAWERQPPADLQALLQRLRIPAVSLAVVRGGVLAWAHAWGVATAGRPEPVTPSTLFQAGSVSKPVAALCALRLVAQGRLDLDADVNQHLSSWKVPANHGWQPRVTVRQLLSHTAGLTVHGFPGYPPAQPLPSLPEVLDGQGNTPPVRVGTIPGLQFSYSGGGYCVLQQLLVDLTGTAFPQLAQELVLGPLGMADSTYQQPLPTRRWTQAARGHRAGGAPVAGGWHAYPEMAAAGLWTTPSDLARFAVAIQQARGGAPGAILPPPLAGELLRPHAPNQRMGLGLRLFGDGAALRFGHDGDDEGFVARLLATAAPGHGVVVMINSDHGPALLGAIVEAVARAEGWQEVLTQAPTPRQAAVGVAGEADLDRWRGRYRLPDGRVLEVDRDGDRLLLATSGQDPLVLVPTGDHGWAAQAVSATVTFTDDDPAPARLVLHQEAPYVQDLQAERV